MIVMKNLRRFTLHISVLFLTATLIASCASSTMIQSIPSGAKLYLNEQPVGNTPYKMRDTKITGTCTDVRLEMDGYEPLYTSICKDEEAHAGAIVGGIFFLIPFLWTMKYQASHTYELYPAGTYDTEDGLEYVPEPTQQRQQQNEPNKVETRSKAERLRELKALHDDGILTKEEFEQEKKKILDED